MKQAKEELKHTVTAYLAKDEAGNYIIPRIRQRPVVLMGPPGIGKTQVMQQVAKECGVLLLSYTITHHTRQSAVGLPFIKEKEFDGKTYSITEYTMSEIIAGLYQKMEESGRREGILFIDEINCVSETLAPAMLAFLQCKTFGNQAVPEGWVIAAAGNPVEYNKSVREFDMVTLDRVRMISIEADDKIWKEYARNQDIHGALLSYLEIRPNNFYRAQADVDGMQYVTARGWEDFSCLLRSYEKMQLPVSEEIVYEYLHHKEVAEDVAAYIDLYRKYQDDYGIEEILLGNVKPAVFARIYKAGLDERISVVNLLIDALMRRFRKVFFEKSVTDAYFDFLKSYRSRLSEKEQDAGEYMRQLSEWEESFGARERDGFMSAEEKAQKKRLSVLLKEGSPGCESASADEAFSYVKGCFDAQRAKLEKAEEEAGFSLEAAFDFMEEAFGQGEEMVIFVTELAVSKKAASFLAECTCERYLSYSGQLLIGTRKREILSELADR